MNKSALSLHSLQNLMTCYLKSFQIITLHYFVQYTNLFFSLYECIHISFDVLYFDVG